jgi:hypothetical protein
LLLPLQFAEAVSANDIEDINQERMWYNIVYRGQYQATGSVILDIIN